MKKYTLKIKSVLPSWIIPVKKLIIGKTHNWCLIPYPNHPKGCPNYNKKDLCPLKAPKLNDYFNINKPLYLVHSEFNLEQHKKKMKELHPNWSSLQCQCVLYWQSISRKQLKQRTIQAMDILNINCYSYIPEAMGLNVYATAIKSGLILEKIKNIKICKHIALIGTFKQK